MPIQVSEISAANHPEFMDHERIYKIYNPKTNITAFIGVHSTALGPALGGIRYKHYHDEQDALGDVLRLSEAMTWKNAAGGLAHGGGKAVIMAGDTPKPDTETLETLAAGLNIINESKPVYFGAEDMNVGESALNHMLKFTNWLKGATSDNPKIVGGDPSPITGLGVYECIKVAVKHKLGKDSVSGLRISMQGLGAVGRTMAEYLHKDGAILTAADPSDEPFEMLRSQGINVEKVDLDAIYDVPADLFAPNAIGGTLTNETIGRLHKSGVKIVCGAANNQQADQKTGRESKQLKSLGILYCPDYIVNAAGVIWVAKVGENAKTTLNDIREGVPRRFKDVLNLSEQNPEADMASLAAKYSRRRVEAAEETRDKSAQTG